MKHTLMINLLLLLPVLLSAQPQGNSEEINTNYKPKYPYGSASITYQVSGDATGTSFLHFDRNGWRSAFTKEISFERYGISSTERSVELTDGDYIFQVNLESNQGKQLTDRNWSSLIAYKNNVEIIAAIIEDQGGKLERADTLLGKPCRVWSFAKGTTVTLWEHQGIPLKMQKKLPGYSYTLEAVSIDSDTSPEPSPFILPEGIEWKND